MIGSNRMTGIQTQSTPPSVGSFRGIIIGCTVFICGEIFGFVIEKGRGKLEVIYESNYKLIYGLNYFFKAA